MGKYGPKGYKAFAHGMVCRGKQYAENTVFEEAGAEDCCEVGVMHYCENPLDVLIYYPLIDDDCRVVEIAEVEPLAEVLRNEDKCATKKLRIGAKIDIGKFAEASAEYLRETTKGSYSAKQVGGNYAKQVGDNYAKQVGGNFARQVGGDFARQVSGSSAQQVSGDYAKQVGGDFAKQVGGKSAQQVGGDYAKQVGGSSAKQVGGSSAEQVGGDFANQVGGYSAKQEAGRNSILVAGEFSRFKAGLHSVVLHYWHGDDGNIAGFKAVQVDGEKIKADTWYTLENGEFVEIGSTKQ